MTRQEKIRFLVYRTIGNFFILLTIFGFLATFGPVFYYEAQFKISNLIGVRYKVAGDNVPDFGQILDRRRALADKNSVENASQGLLNAMVSGEKEQILVPPNTEFSVVIPKIGASEKVSINVDPSNEKEFQEVLKYSVAHARGSAYPGLNGNTYLFAHSAATFWDVGRYNAVFYLIKDLESGDDITVFYRNKRYNYKVYDKKIVEADEVQYVNANVGSGEVLTLQTCWPPGTAWKRLLVFAKPELPNAISNK